VGFMKSPFHGFSAEFAELQNLQLKGEKYQGIYDWKIVLLKSQISCISENVTRKETNFALSYDLGTNSGLPCIIGYGYFIERWEN